MEIIHGSPSRTSKETVVGTPPRPPKKRRPFSRLKLFENHETDDENARSGFDVSEEFPDDLVIDSSASDQPKIYWELCKACNVHHTGGCPKTTEKMCQLDIGDNVFLVANMFHGQRLIHIRQYEIPDKRPMYPTKRGITLDLEKLKKLMEFYKDGIDEAVTIYKNGKDVDFMVHLGSNFHVSLKTGYPLVNIRRWFKPTGAGDIMPTKKGIALNFDQWEKLKDAMIIVAELLAKELGEVEYCEMQNDHMNQEGFWRCSNCNPNMDYM